MDSITPFFRKVLSVKGQVCSLAVCKPCDQGYKKEQDAHSRPLASLPMTNPMSGLHINGYGGWIVKSSGRVSYY